LDHNHTTKQFRGYLCHSCNRTIGQLDEDISRLYRAIEYLQNAN
jgi:transposase-like protein